MDKIYKDRSCILRMVMGLKNRKGDVTITTVILIVLGLAVLVLLIIGFTKGWDFFFGIFDSGPSDLQTVAKACIGYVEASLSIDFCKYRLIEVDGKDELVNCNDGRILESLNTDGVNVPSALASCQNDAQNRQTACERISASKRAGTKINGNAGSCGGVSGIVVNPETLTVVEGSTATFTITLSSPPSRSVKLTVEKSGDADIVITGSGLTANPAGSTTKFETAEFIGDQPPVTLTVTVNAGEDTDTTPGTATVRIYANGFAQKTLTITEDDNDDTPR